MVLSIDSREPQPWLVARVVQSLQRDGLVVTPTDTVYAIACRLGSPTAIERLYEVKRIDPSKRLSLLVPDIATASRYVRGIPTTLYRAMRRVLPGPYTFIFPASEEVPRIMLRKRRAVGIRVPDCAIVQAVLAEIGEPLLSTSVRNDADEWLLDPLTIESDLDGRVDLVVDGGLLAADPSTVVDLSGDEPILIRTGKGDPDALGLF